MSDWRSSIIGYVRENARPVDKFSHQLRLYNLTRGIGEGLEYDDDVVFAAAWLHDIGVFIGHRPEDPEALSKWDMLAYAMREVPGILASCGFPVSKVPPVVECIRTHQPSGKPATLEGDILRDGDILELLGATGILRAVSKVGRDTRYHTFEDILPVLQQNLEKLPTLLKLDSSRTLAVSRVKCLRDWLDQARSEGLAT